MLNKVNLVVFDFDGTLSGKDANVEFAKYCIRRSVRPWLFAPLVIVASIAKLFNPGGIWWRQTMRRFLTADMVTEFAPEFIKQHKQERFGWSKEHVKELRDAGYTVILISASPDYLLPHLVRDIKFDAVMCSKMDQEKPWKYEFLCWGSNKVIAMDEWAKKNKYLPKVVRSYSDSKTDMPLMKIAQHKIWIDPKTGTRI